MKLRFLLFCSLAVTGLAQTNAPAPLFPFVLPWDDASPSLANASAWLDKPAGAHGFVTAKDGHLYAGDKRIRFFGVNICFGGAFPKHEDADKVAARLAKFGVNCIRFHHMDTGIAPRGLLQPDKRTLDPGQLDKLDYFIAQLKKNGIYADLNLHVGRTYPGLPTWETMPHYHKGVDNFHPEMIKLQREYARDLLTHVNPYTQTHYTDEPAVAFIEINNENGLFREWFDTGLEELAPAIADEFTRQWNDWLKTQYTDTAALRRVWNDGEQPLGAELLATTNRWHLEQHHGARAALTTTNDTLRLDITKTGTENWHVQLNQAGVRVERGHTYTISFRAKTDARRKLSVGLSQTHDPWRSLAHTSVRLTRDWQTFTLPVSPDADEADARFIFSGLGMEKCTIGFADISLKPGGILGVRDGESLGTIGAFRKAEFATRAVAAQRDWIRFLWDTEQRYWTGMARYLKDDLKARSLVVGTQLGYSPPGIQSQLDVVDIHSYWQHPRFPGKPWDPNNWLIKNTSMAAAPDGGTLPRLIGARVPGKPYICTEYNHPAPNTFNSEGFLMLAAVAAREDWDGVFAFAYNHRTDDWNPGKITSFFDIDQHPTQMATFPAAVAMFCAGNVPAAPTPFPALDTAATQEKMRTAGPWSLWKLPPWDQTNGVFTVTAPRAKAVIGFTRGRTFDLGNNIRIAPGPTRQDWSAITITEMAPHRWLITATGYAENTGMGWKNSEHTTVGRDWGQAPSLVEGIPATITLPGATKAWALDERGQRKAELPVRDSIVEIGPQQQTLWYEVETR